MAKPITLRTPVQKREYKRNWARANGKPRCPIKRRAEHVRKAYGLTTQQYKDLQQKHPVCAICQNLCATGRRLAVDHNHITKQVRGLLCAQCNRSLGGFKGDLGTDLLNRAIRYLMEN